MVKMLSNDSHPGDDPLLQQEFHPNYPHDGKEYILKANYSNPTW